MPAERSINGIIPIITGKTVCTHGKALLSEENAHEMAGRFMTRTTLAGTICMTENGHYVSDKWEKVARYHLSWREPDTNQWVGSYYVKASDQWSKRMGILRKNHSSWHYFLTAMASYITDKGKLMAMVSSSWWRIRYKQWIGSYSRHCRWPQWENNHPKPQTNYSVVGFCLFVPTKSTFELCMNKSVGKHCTPSSLDTLMT